MSRAIIQSVIIQTTFGVPFFEHHVKTTSAESRFDGTLVGGMSSAVSSMWSDFARNSEVGFEVMEREGTTITSHKTELSTMLLISKKRFPQVEMNRLERIHSQIESHFPQIEQGSKSGIITRISEDEVITIFRNNNINI